MKKILYGLTSLMLTNTTAIKAVACTPKVSRDVILEVSTDNPGSAIVQAYRNVVAQFNQDYPNSPLKIKLLVTPLNSIKDKIATGLALPNLYLAYADPIANYDILLQLRDQARGVVNVAEVINWDQGQTNDWWKNEEDQWIKPYLSNATRINAGLFGDKTLSQVLETILHTNLTYRPFINSFLRESLIPGEAADSVFMYSAPVVKSTFIGTVNLRLLNELVVHVLGKEAELKLKDDDREIREPYFINEPQIALKDIKINSSQNPYSLSSKNRYLKDNDLTFGTFLKQFSGSKTKNEIQRLLGDLANVEVLLSTYWNLVGNSQDNTQDKWIKTLGYGTDDVFATTGLMQGHLTGDFKQITAWDPKQPFDLMVDTKNPKLHQGLSDFLNFIQWGNTHKELLANGSNVADHGNGGLGIKANSTSKDYYSNQWIKQGMLFYYSSSAGIKYLTSDKPDQVHKEDVLLVPTPIYEKPSEKSDWNMLFRQQGAGIGMFKDNNFLKNQVAAAFLNYFLSPQVNAEFAIEAGYIPTNYSAYYTQDQPKDSLPDYDSLYLKELLKENTRIQGAPLIWDLINQLATQKIKLWISEPSPFSEMINLQVFQPWFQKNYKTFFGDGPNSRDLTWAQFEQDFYWEAKRVINSMLPGISKLVWNGVREK